MEFKNLSEISHIRNENIINNTNSSLIYVTTSNILPNKKGIDLNLEMSFDKSGKKFYKNDILVSNIRPYFKKIWKANMDGITSNDVLIFYPNEEVNLDYLYFVLAQDDFFDYATKTSKGTKMPRGDKAAINKFKILLPKLNIQMKIASILSNLDSKIEINNKIISNLESQAQAIFKSWFVDFEPFQDGNFVESELGMIPEGWEVKKVNEICDLKIGRTPPRKESEWFSLKEGVKWVSIKDLGLSQMYISEVTEYLTEESIEKFNIPIVEENTLLLSFKLTVGRIAITTEKMCTNEAIAQFKDPLISTLFLFYYFKNFKFETLGNTSSIGNAVNSKIIKNIEVLVPPEKIVLKVMKMIEPLSICIRNLLTQNTKLAELRDALLPKLMAGEIDVSNIKIEGEEVKNE